PTPESYTLSLHDALPISSAIEVLEAAGLRAVPEFGRFPIQVTVDDFEAAHWIVALKEAEHLPLLQERFPAWAEKVEFWQVDDAPDRKSTRLNSSHVAISY